MDLILKYQKKTTGKAAPPPKKKLILHGEVGASPHDYTIESSDGEDTPSEYFMNYSDAEDVINDGAHDNRDLSLDDPIENNNSNALESIIAKEYCEEEAIPVLPPIHEKLALVLTK